MQRLAGILFIPLCVAAQQRTPGRVAGSPNNPQTTTRATETNATARPAALKALAADPDFNDAKSVYPDLSPEGYRRLQFFSRELKARYGIDRSVHDLARSLSEVQGDPVRLLLKTGIPRKEASQLSKRSLP